MLKRIASNMDDLLLFAGCTLIVIGVAMFSIPAAFIVAGICCVVVGYMIGKVKAQNVI